MRHRIKRLVRSLALPWLRQWQWFYDYSRAKWREYREHLLDYHEQRRIQRDGTIVVRDVYDTRFVLYPYDRPNLLNLVRRPYDIAEVQAVRRLVRSGNIAFDIGANVGLYSVLLSRLCGPEGQVWSFEPVTETYWRLRETLALNRCENVIPKQLAVCSESGYVRMNLFEPQFAEWNSLGTPTMGPANQPIAPNRSADVPACVLDQFCEKEKIERINLLKVDVEGFELAVFRGAKRLLQERRVDYICFEISQASLRGAGIASRDVFAVLEAEGYAAYRFEVKTGSFLGPVHDTPEEWVNFFASWQNLSRLGGQTPINAHKESLAVAGQQ
jgi:FkbM family methyltransferase